MAEHDFPPQFANAANALIATFAADGDNLLFTAEDFSVTQESQRRFLVAMERVLEGMVEAHEAGTFTPADLKATRTKFMSKVSLQHESPIDFCLGMKEGVMCRATLTASRKTSSLCTACKAQDLLGKALGLPNACPCGGTPCAECTGSIGENESVVSCFLCHQQYHTACADVIQKRQGLAPYTEVEDRHSVCAPCVAGRWFDLICLMAMYKENTLVLLGPANGQETVGGGVVHEAHMELRIQLADPEVGTPE
jgi:hypothetical protein